jgi:hypothetical protein
MKHYINQATGDIYAYESDGSQDAFIKQGLVPLSDEVLSTLRAKPIAQVRADKLAQLDAARKAAETASVTVAGKPYPATEEFQAKISRTLNYVGRGKPLNLDGAWRDSNASPVTMNAALLGQIEDAITTNGVVAWKNYWTKFDAVMAADTAEAVNAVEW